MIGNMIKNRVVEMALRSLDQHLQKDLTKKEWTIISDHLHWMHVAGYENEFQTRFPNAKRILMYKKGTNEVINSFDSAREAAENIGTDKSSVAKVARGVKKSIRGYTFKYEK